ncbi:MAG: RNHCP domain-containing protein [Patescibacteria group bacterium]
MSSKFKRQIENFVCENCGKKVDGNGYTNHCPHCLWSKHVDIFPGDRAETCGGMMEPVDTEENGGEWHVIQKCGKCGKIHKNKISTNDCFDCLVKIKKDKI